MDNILEANHILTLSDEMEKEFLEICEFDEEIKHELINKIGEKTHLIIENNKNTTRFDVLHDEIMVRHASKVFHIKIKATIKEETYYVRIVDVLYH